MRYSQIFGKTSKAAPADADSVNAALLTRGGFISRQIAGIYNYLPLGLRVLRKIERIITEEMEATGANQILMPALSHEESWKTTGRENMDVLFKTVGHGDMPLMLNPTHEEIVTPLVQKYVFSYKDLPVAVFQIQNKFRNEARAKSGLLRGREFSMKDLYSFHTSQESLDAYYEVVKQAYHKVYSRLGIGEGTLFTYASGGAFSKYSHEFQTLSDVGEDTIYVCEKCHIAINKEIIADQSTCPECGNKDLTERKGIEVGNIFKLGTRFSDAFGFRYQSAEGKEESIPMGCYGMGPSRIMGTIVEVSNDDRGIIWPKEIAPFAVHLLTIGMDEEVTKASEKLYKELLDAKIEVLFDDRDTSAGAKLADSDLIGIPVRLVISKRTLEQGTVEMKKREEKEVIFIPIEKIQEAILS